MPAEQESYREYYKWANDGQWECIEMLADLFGGFHHISEKVKDCGPSGIECSTRKSRFASFDFNGLTEAVVLAHDRCIRFEIDCSGPGMLRLKLHKRRREGDMSERHPHLGNHVSLIRERFNR